MSGNEECPNCKQYLSGDGKCRECGWPEHGKTMTPDLDRIEGSEIDGMIDIETLDPDGIRRPIMVNQDGHDMLELTVADARRLHKWLSEALPYLEQLANMRGH